MVRSLVRSLGRLHPLGTRSLSGGGGPRTLYDKVWDDHVVTQTADVTCTFVDCTAAESNKEVVRRRYEL